MKCKDHTKIPSDRPFGIGDHLFKIKINVELPVEEADMEEPIDEDLEGNNTEAALDKNRKDEEMNNREKGSSRTGSSHSLQSSKSVSGNSNQSTKQKRSRSDQMIRNKITRRRHPSFVLNHLRGIETVVGPHTLALLHDFHG